MKTPLILWNRKTDRERRDDNTYDWSFHQLLISLHVLLNNTVCGSMYCCNKLAFTIKCFLFLPSIQCLFTHSIYWRPLYMVFTHSHTDDVASGAILGDLLAMFPSKSDLNYSSFWSFFTSFPSPVLSTFWVYLICAIQGIAVRIIAAAHNFPMQYSRTLPTGLWRSW